MRTWDWHYHQAELLLAQADRQYTTTEQRLRLVMEAQVHATLASIKYESN